MAKDPSNEIINPKDVNESNFKDYLEQNNFNKWEKLASDYNKSNLSYNDIITMNETLLEKMLIDDYKIKAVQASRFINAVKKLPNSRVSGM